jgi:hypothetical protein
MKLLIAAITLCLLVGCSERMSFKLQEPMKGKVYYIEKDVSVDVVLPKGCMIFIGR